MTYEMTKKFEGCGLKAYPDPGSGNVPWTIGYGHTRGVKPGDVCTQDQADDWLELDMSIAQSAVVKLVTVPIGPNQTESLSDFVFNLGETQFASSTLLKMLNASDYVGASKQFARWNLASGKVLNGLVARRAAEKDMFCLDAPFVERA
jgi:lysozyme